MSAITYEDVVKANEAHPGRVLTCDFKKFRDLLASGGKQDCTYLDVRFKHADGREVYPRFKFLKIVIGSAKLPPQSEEDPKHVIISFKKLTEEILNVGDYAAKSKKGKDEKEKAEKKALALRKEYVKRNHELLEMFDIIDESLQNLYKDLKTAHNNKELGFKLIKNRQIKKAEHLATGSIIQKNREDKETGELIPLDGYIYRLKLPIVRVKTQKGQPECVYNGLIGFYNRKKEEFSPTVFNTRKMKKNGFKPVAAKVKTKEGTFDLSADNFDMFLTPRSLTGGSFTIRGITVSKWGLSSPVEFRELFVKRHKAKVNNDSLNAEEVAEMHGGGGDDDSSDDEDEFMDEQQEEKKEEGNAERDAKSRKSKQSSGSDEEENADASDSNARRKAQKPPKDSDDESSDDEDKPAKDAPDAEEDKDEPAEDDANDANDANDATGAEDNKEDAANAEENDDDDEDDEDDDDDAGENNKDDDGGDASSDDSDSDSDEPEPEPVKKKGRGRKPAAKSKSDSAKSKESKDGKRKKGKK